MVEPGTLAEQTGAELQKRLDLLPYARRERLDVPRNELAIELGHQTLIGVVRQTRMFARFAVEKQVQFLWCILGDLLVVVEEARTPIQIAFPVSKSWGDDSTFIQRPGWINQCFRGNADLTAQAITLRTHALGVVEGKCICIAHVGFTDPRKEQAQHRRDVSHRAHRLRLTSGAAIKEIARNSLVEWIGKV